MLLVGAGGDVKVGSPYLAGSTVSAEVVKQGRHDKIRIIKFRRRKHYKRETGHRQWYHGSQDHRHQRRLSVKE